VIVLDASATVDLPLATERAAAIAQVLSAVGEAHAPELIDPGVLAVIRRWTLRGWPP
jgi:predicted nucleic acid-binding protein